VGVVVSSLSRKDAGQLSLFAADRVAEREERQERLAAAVDDVRRRFGFAAITAGRSVDLLGKLRRDANGYVLRTPCLTK
jgi:hypothetical protein